MVYCAKSAGAHCQCRHQFSHSRQIEVPFLQPPSPIGEVKESIELRTDRQGKREHSLTGNVVQIHQETVSMIIGDFDYESPFSTCRVKRPEKEQMRLGFNLIHNQHCARRAANPPITAGAAAAASTVSATATATATASSRHSRELCP